jgi:ATP-dependent DNA ligase
MLDPARRLKAGFEPPCLPKPAKEPPAGPGWIHEIKHDGFRILARKEARGMRLIIGRLRRAFWPDLISSAM